MDENTALRILETHNYWLKEQIINIGHKRTLYLNKIAKFINSDLIKVLVGQRRSGKSFILRQIINDLINNGVDRKNILYINFEIEDFLFIQTKETLSEVIKIYLENIKNKKQKKFYLFFDEIQEVKEWEKLINSYIANQNYEVEIFITGSNSRLLSTEFSTYISGRYVELNIYPLTFDEYIGFANLESNRTNFLQYLNTSQSPAIFKVANDRDTQTDLLRSIKNSILMNDIIKRFNVDHPDILEKIFLFICDNIGNLLSLNSLNKKLKSQNIKVSTTTLSSYIKYLEYSFLIHSVDRYDLKGKRILEGEKKYYLNDIGFRNFFFSTFDNASSKKLENYIYQVLIAKDYKVHVGKINDLEIDFVAEKLDRKIYLQSCFLIDSDKVEEREYRSLALINDNWEKLIISTDDSGIKTKNGIKHIEAWELGEIL